MKSIKKFKTKEVKNQAKIKGGEDLKEMAEALVNLTVKDVNEL